MNDLPDPGLYSRMRDLVFHPAALAAPLGLSLGGAAAEWLCAFLLIPAVEASIRLDFDALGGSRLLASVLSVAPSLSNLQPKSQFLLLLGAIAAAALTKTALIHAGAVRFTRAIHEVTGKVRVRLFRRCLAGGKRYFDTGSTAQVQNIITSQVNRVASHALILQDSSTHLFLLAAYCLIMAGVSWKLTLVVALVLPVLHGSGALLVSGIRKASHDNSEAQRAMSERIAETFRSIVLVQVENAQDFEAERFRAAVERADGLHADMDIRSSLTPRLQESIFVLMLVAMLFGLAYYAGPQRADLVPSLFVFVYVARRASISAMAVLRLRTSAALVDGAVKDIAALLAKDAPGPVPDGDLPFRGLRDSLVVRDLFFSYGNGAPALEGVSLQVQKGSTVALVGPSGAGKSSLVHVLLRLYAPSAGKILLDGTELSRFTATTLAEKIAFIPQSPQLLDDTLRGNLEYPHRASRPDSALKAALRNAALLDEVEAMEAGLDTRVGEAGVRLSGGEKQRLAIARAMLKEADILILDEATSALDSATESLVRKSFIAATAGRTAIVVAHRLSTIQHADKILVMDRGKIVEEGSFEALKARDGLFRRMLEAQEFT